MTEIYRRRTVRPLQKVIHLKLTDTGQRLCGLEYEAAKPMATVFHAGDPKVDAVKVSCPVCEALAVLLNEAHALAAEDHFGIDNGRRRQAA